MTVPPVAPARVFTLGDFAPTGPIVAGRPTKMTFAVKLPNGKTLTSYKTGAGPHTGVHLIIVRKDLAYIIHDHPPVPLERDPAPVSDIPGAGSLPGAG